METWKPSWLLLPRHVKSWGMMSWLEWSNMPQRENNGGSGIMMKTTSPRRSFKMLSSKTSSFQISSKRHFLLPCFRFVDDDFTQKIKHVLWKCGGKFLKSSSNSSVEKNIFNWQVVVFILKKYANLQSVFSSNFLKMKNCRTLQTRGKSPQRFPPFFAPLRGTWRQHELGHNDTSKKNRRPSQQGQPRRITTNSCGASETWGYSTMNPQIWMLGLGHPNTEGLQTNGFQLFKRVQVLATLTTTRSSEIYFSPSRPSRQETDKRKIPAKRITILLSTHHHPATQGTIQSSQHGIFHLGLNRFFGAPEALRYLQPEA